MTTDEFRHQVTQKLPGAKIEITSAPSGAFMANISINATLYVVEFQPGIGYGVSRCCEKDLVFSAHELQVQTPEDALSELEKLVSN